jgi:hypothetical protein
VNGLAAIVIGNRYATMRDLEEYYSMPDLLDMAEISMIDDYNQWVIRSKAK